MSAPQPPWHRLRIESLAHATRYTTHAMTYGIQEVANECRIGAKRYPCIATTNPAPPSSAPTMRADRCDSFMGSRADPISSTAFRGIESLVSRLEQLRRFHPSRHGRNPTAEGDRDARIVEDEVMPLTGATKIVTAASSVLASGFRKDETQLFSTVASQTLLAPRAVPKHSGQLTQHEVAGQVPVPVVHVLEVVDVDQQDGQRAAVSRRACDLTLEKLKQVAPVVELGERIRDGQAIERVMVVRFNSTRPVCRQQLEHHGPHADEISRGQQPLAAHALVIHERPVRRTVIARDDTVGTRDDRAVPTRNALRFDGDIAFQRSAEGSEGPIQEHGAPEIGTMDLHEARPFEAPHFRQALGDPCLRAHLPQYWQPYCRSQALPSS